VVEYALTTYASKVLNDLPSKTERIEWCDMTKTQQKLYKDAMQRSRKTVLDATPPVSGQSTPLDTHATSKKKGTQQKSKAKAYLENSTNVLMDLRKAASHPMLFRNLFTDSILSSITKQLLKEPDFRKRGALFDIVKEDMSVMTDAELQVFCATYKVQGSLYI
jgi:SWI/SNF-related matrix-associated actin-dependent regulator of chromatin subfamily A containing DEAD/H box 1